MDRIDILGDEYDGFQNFTKELLAETYDEELQQIVEDAARELNSPMALVSLILDQIQFFKAHVGLPSILKATRGTHRDASFCQFVVKDGNKFEVNDGPNDSRIPQHVVKEFNIQSYLGIPIKVGDAVVGSLCVLDTKKRQFSKHEHQKLEDLAELVNKRLTVLTKSRRQARMDLSFSSIQPAIVELRNILEPLQEHTRTAYSQLATIKSFLDLYKHTAQRRSKHSDIIDKSYKSAVNASEQLRDQIVEIEMSLWDGFECLDAMSSLDSTSTQSSLGEILISAQELTRNATRSVGGFTLPHLDSDPVVFTKANLSIALISNCLLSLSRDMIQTDSKAGIKLQVYEAPDNVELQFKAGSLDNKAYELAVNQLIILIGKNHPTISLKTDHESMSLIFKVKK